MPCYPWWRVCQVCVLFCLFFFFLIFKAVSVTERKCYWISFSRPSNLGRGRRFPVWLCILGSKGRSLWSAITPKRFCKTSLYWWEYWGAGGWRDLLSMGGEIKALLCVGSRTLYITVACWSSRRLRMVLAGGFGAQFLRHGWHWQPGELLNWVIKVINVMQLTKTTKITLHNLGEYLLYEKLK